MHKLEEFEFIDRINKKDKGCFHTFFVELYAYLVVFAMRRISDKEVCEDIVQESFISIWQENKEFNSFKGLKAWIYKLVENKCFNYIKHKSIEEKYCDFILKDKNSSSNNYDLTQEEIYRELYLAIKKLPERCRCVMELALEEKSNAEIAEILNISIQTVKAHKQNALHALRKSIGDIVLLLPFFTKNKNILNVL